MSKINKKVNYARLEKLISQEVQPEDMAESCFCIAYERGKVGDLLMNLITTFPLNYDKLTDHERDHLIYGYSLGQEWYAVFEMEQQYYDEETH